MGFAALRGCALDERGERFTGVSFVYVERCAAHSDAQIRQLLFAGLRGKGKGEPELVPATREFKVPNPEWEAWSRSGQEGKAPPKQKTILLRGIVTKPIDPPAYTASGLPSVSSIMLRLLVGKSKTAAELLERWDQAVGSPQWDSERDALEQEAVKRCGGVFNAFGGGRNGIEAAAAIDALCEASSVGTLLTGFILPLQVRQAV